MSSATRYLEGLISPEAIASVHDRLKESAFPVSENHGCFIFPGFCDVHVHLREPGFSYKETIKTGSLSCARGGYTNVCAMPNLDPVPDSLRHIMEELSIIERDSCIRVHPYGAVTVGERGEKLADLEGMASLAVAFSDDGKGVQQKEMMRKAMVEAKRLGKVIAAHCEEDALLNGGYIHKGAYARAHGHPGICSESEWIPVKRDLELAKETGAAYHVCHISTKESADLIRKAKAEGIDVTCETAPHYLLMDDSFLEEDGRFKMNPPLRSAGDRKALIEALKDGTIDMIATDHAPHSLEEKSRGLEKSAFGITGIETAFPLLYTYLCKPGVISLPHLMRLLVTNPMKRFNIPAGEDFSVWDLEKEYIIDPAEFVSKGKSTPFAGWKVSGRCLLTVCGGRTVWEERENA